MVRPTQWPTQPGPVEARPRIDLAARRNVLVAGHEGDGIALCDGRQQARQRLVLCGLEALALQALELDANRIVVAGVAPTPG